MSRSNGNTSLETVFAAFAGSYLTFTGALAMVRDASPVMGALLFGLGLALLIARTPTLARSVDEAERLAGIRMAIVVATGALCIAGIAALA